MNHTLLLLSSLLVWVAVCVCIQIVPVPINTALLGGAGGCNNTADLTVFNKTWTTFHGTLQSCAVSCLAKEDCIVNCEVAKLGLSKACSTCFAVDAVCTAEHCALPCFNPGSAACVACSKKNCLPGLVTCAGVPADKLPQ
eukprot:TRINITY_DN3626_c0_g1_i1.p1 TRINITY_DN3626_c0_g1~~TRINITY_DN3626_c0_g1_i1.p1  ORF type:complete len:160 (-),score=49.51 TRINITY_DN3626_c0_g1_i1:27-446(-)